MLQENCCRHAKPSLTIPDYGGGAKPAFRDSTHTQFRFYGGRLTSIQRPNLSSSAKQRCSFLPVPNRTLDGRSLDRRREEEHRQQRSNLPATPRAADYSMTKHSERPFGRFPPTATPPATIGRLCSEHTRLGMPIILVSSARELKNILSRANERPHARAKRDPPLISPPLP